MKNPFVILLAAAVVVGVGIGVVAVILLGASSEDSSTDEALPIASEADFPTPSSRNAREREPSEDDRTESQVVVVSTSVSKETFDADEVVDVEGLVEQDGAQVVVTVEVSGEGRPGGQRGFGGGGPGGAGGPDFEAIQEAMESNPEIQELIQKAQSGNMSQEDQARLRQLMQEALAEAGIEEPGGGFAVDSGGGFGAPPIQGEISAIDGSNITIDHSDDSGLSTDAQIGDDTNITLIRELAPSDLTEGANVAGSVQRGEGGRIYIVNLTVIPEQQARGFRGMFAGPGTADTNATNLSNISGTVASVDGQTVSVETTQGTLRLTANEDSNILSTSQGTLDDISEGMSAIAFGGNPDDAPIQPTNLIVGPDTLLQGVGIPQGRGSGAGRQGN